MRPSAWLSGFNYLHREGDLPAPALWRAALLGLLLGLLAAHGWGRQAQQALDEQLQHQHKLQAELAQVQQLLQQRTEQARVAQAGRVQWARVQGWQDERQRLLGGLQAWSASAGVELTEVRFDPQALSVRGRMAPAGLQQWAKSHAPPGAGPVQLLELAAEPAGLAAAGGAFAFPVASSVSAASAASAASPASGSGSVSASASAAAQAASSAGVRFGLRWPFTPASPAD